MAGRADGGGWRLHVDVPELPVEPGGAVDGRSSNGAADGDGTLGGPTGSLDAPSVRAR
jgi:hypothetical protein